MGFILITFLSTNASCMVLFIKMYIYIFFYDLVPGNLYKYFMSSPIVKYKVLHVSIRSSLLIVLFKFPILMQFFILFCFILPTLGIVGEDIVFSFYPSWFLGWGSVN